MNNSSQTSSANLKLNIIDPNSRRKKALGELARNGNVILPEDIAGEEHDNVMASEEELKGRKIIKLKSIKEIGEKEENLNLFPKDNDKLNEKKILNDNPFDKKDEKKNEFTVSNLSDNNPFANLLKNNKINTFLGTEFSNPFLNKNTKNEEPPTTTNANSSFFTGGVNNFVNPFFKKSDSTLNGIKTGLNSFNINENNMFFGKINTNITICKDPDSDDECEENPESEIKIENDTTKVKDIFKDSKPEVSPYTKAIKIGCSNFFVFQKNSQKYAGKGEGFFSVEYCEGKNGLIVALVYRNNTNTIFNGTMIPLKTSLETVQNEYKKFLVIKPVLSKEDSNLVATSLKIIPINDTLFNQLHEILKESKAYTYL